MAVEHTDRRDDLSTSEPLSEEHGDRDFVPRTLDLVYIRLMQLRPFVPMLSLVAVGALAAAGHAHHPSDLLHPNSAGCGHGDGCGGSGGSNGLGGSGHPGGGGGGHGWH